MSVIIPVYNAAPFVKKAIESALNQKEVSEVILVNDFSKDSSWEICRQLSLKYEKIILIDPPQGRNVGAGLSRNLGIKAANCRYVAFLDADDFYAEGRFAADAKVFENNSKTDGVYNAIGFCYYKNGKSEIGNNGNLTGLSAIVNSEELIFALLGLKPEISGHLHLDGLTLKREVFAKVSGFSPLRLHQDAAFIIKLAATCNLMAASIHIPVAYRGVHGSNRITSNHPKSTRSVEKYYRELYYWSKEIEVKPLVLFFKTKFFLEKMICNRNKMASFFILIYLLFLTKSFIKYDCIFNEGIIASFGKQYGRRIINGKELIFTRLLKVNCSVDQLFKEFPKKTWFQRI